jgi:hypothetical protein
MIIKARIFSSWRQYAIQGILPTLSHNSHCYPLIY